MLTACDVINGRLDYFTVIYGLKCLQTDSFVNSLKDSNTTLSDDDRLMIQAISQNLNAALQPSTTDNRPIPPQDLRTIASFLEVVAE